MNILLKLKEIKNSRSNDFWLYGVSSFFHEFSGSLLSIFLPIFMLLAGFSIQSIVIYLIIYYFLSSFLTIFIRKIVLKIGSFSTLIISKILWIIYFINLAFLDSGSFFLLWSLAILGAVYDAFYYVPSVYAQIKQTKILNNTAKNNSFFSALMVIAQAFGPILSSIILLLTENKVLVLIPIIISIIVSIFFLSLMKNIREIPEPHNFDPKNFFKDKQEKKNFLTFAFERIQTSVNEYIWPIFIFLSFEGIRSVAILAIIMPLASVLILFINTKTKRENREKIIIASSFFLIFIWILRMNFDIEFLLYLGTAFFALILLFLQIPLGNNMQRRAIETSVLEASTYRNFVSMFSKGLFYLLVFFLLKYFEIFTLTFYSAIVALVLIILINIPFVRKNKGI